MVEFFWTYRPVLLATGKDSSKEQTSSPIFFRHLAAFLKTKQVYFKGLSSYYFLIFFFFDTSTSMNHIWKTASLESSKIVLLCKYSLDNVTIISAQKIQVNLVNLLIIVLHDIYHHTFLIFTDVNWFKIHSKSAFFSVYYFCFTLIKARLQSVTLF